MDEFINNQIRFVNTLLKTNEIKQIQYSINNCSIILTDIITLEHNLDKLYYAVNAKLYDDSIKIITLCKKQFSIYEAYIEEDYLKKIYCRYTEIVNLIKTMVLNDVDKIIDSNTIDHGNINNIYDLLDILNDDDRESFMDILCQKIVSIKIENL